MNRSRLGHQVARIQRICAWKPLFKLNCQGKVCWNQHPTLNQNPKTLKSCNIKYTLILRMPTTSTSQLRILVTSAFQTQVQHALVRRGEIPFNCELRNFLKLYINTANLVDTYNSTRKSGGFSNIYRSFFENRKSTGLAGDLTYFHVGSTASKHAAPNSHTWVSHAPCGPHDSTFISASDLEEKRFTKTKLVKLVTWGS